MIGKTKILTRVNLRSFAGQCPGSMTANHARIGRTFFRSDPAAKEQFDVAADQHDEIINAMERHDSEAAALIVRAHFDLSRRNLAAYVIPEVMEVPVDV